MDGIRAKYISKKTMADDSIRFTFSVEPEFAALADKIMGVPTQKTGGKDYNIILHVDEPTAFYSIAEEERQQEIADNGQFGVGA